MRVLDAEATRLALPFDCLIPALRSLFASGCTVPRREVHDVGGRFTSLVMPAWIAGHRYGIKTINIAPGNASIGLPGLHAGYLLFDGTTGVPLASIDGSVLTARRTAATSALAAASLARADARRLLVVGAGAVARLVPEAMAAVRPIDDVQVWARSPERAEALADEWRRAGIAATATRDLEASAETADIVCSATAASAPILHGRSLSPGSHLDLVGSFAPAMREADDDCLRGASIWIDDTDALAKSGDLLDPIASGAIRADDIRGTLAALVRGDVDGRRTDSERTVFKSVGSALADLAGAMLAHDPR